MQTQTSADFCPHCGSSYVGRRRRLCGKTVDAMVTVRVLLGGTAVGITLKVQHDRDPRTGGGCGGAPRGEASNCREGAGRRRAAEAARRERRAAKAAAEQSERNLIKQMQQSVIKDAKERVADGELEGPIYYTSCDPLGGGSVDDLTALTSTFEFRDRQLG